MRACNTVLAALALSTPCLGEDQRILNCNDLACPVEAQGTSSNCTVQGHTFDTVGAVQLDGPSENLGLTLTASVVKSEDRDRVVRRRLYAGVQAQSAQQPICGLALVDYSNADAQLFYNVNSNSSTATTSCDGVFQDDCQSAIRDRVLQLSQQQDMTCESLAQRVQASIPRSCTNILPSAKVMGQYVSGPMTATGLITQQQNASTNCWPTAPKTNSLVDLFSFDIDTTVFANGTQAALLGVTPVMAVTMGQSSSDDGNAQLQCMRPLALSSKAAETTKDNSGPAVSANWTVLLVGIIASGIFLL